MMTLKRHVPLLEIPMIRVILKRTANMLFASMTANRMSTHVSIMRTATSYANKQTTATLTVC